MSKITPNKNPLGVLKDAGGSSGNNIKCGPVLTTPSRSRHAVPRFPSRHLCALSVYHIAGHGVKSKTRSVHQTPWPREKSAETAGRVIPVT